jgi:hypothetical protein
MAQLATLETYSHRSSKAIMAERGWTDIIIASRGTQENETLAAARHYRDACRTEFDDYLAQNLETFKAELVTELSMYQGLMAEISREDGDHFHFRGCRWRSSG